MPDFFSAYAVAGMGAVNIQTGSAPRTLMWWMRARGFSLCSFTARSEATSIAQPASEIWLDTAHIHLFDSSGKAVEAQPGAKAA